MCEDASMIAILRQSTSYKPYVDSLKSLMLSSAQYDPNPAIAFGAPGNWWLAGRISWPATGCRVGCVGSERIRTLVELCWRWILAIFPGAGQSTPAPMGFGALIAGLPQDYEEGSRAVVALCARTAVKNSWQKVLIFSTQVPALRIMRAGV